MSVFDKFDRINHYRTTNVKSLERELDLCTSIMAQLVESNDLADIHRELKLVTKTQSKVTAIHRCICTKMREAVSRSIFQPLSDWFRDALSAEKVRDLDALMFQIDSILAGKMESVEAAYEAGDSYTCPLLKAPTSVTSSRYAIAVLRATLEKLLERIKTPAELRLCLTAILETCDRIATTAELVFKFEKQDKQIMESSEGHTIIDSVCEGIADHLRYLCDGYLDRPYHLTLQRIQYAVDLRFWEHNEHIGPKPDWHFTGVKSGDKWEGQRLYQYSTGLDREFRYYGTEWGDEPACYALMIQCWLESCGLPGATELLEEFSWEGRESEKDEITNKALAEAYTFWRQHESS